MGYSQNPFNTLLPDLNAKPPMIPSEVVKGDVSQDMIRMIQKAGITADMVSKSIQEDLQISWDRWNIYQEVERAIHHWMVGPAIELYANTSCLTGGTKIPLLNGDVVTIEQLVKTFSDKEDVWVYSCDIKGRPCPAKVLRAIKQKHKPKTLRVWLDNGEFVEASINHRFIKRDGTICRADELSVGDSLMPFHRSPDPAGYERVWDVEKKNWRSTYKVVASETSGVNLEEVNLGKKLEEEVEYIVVHHKDFNKNNNHPDNLQLMSHKEHIQLHSGNMLKRWQDPEWREMMIQKNKDSHNTKEYLKVLSERHTKWWDSEEGQKYKEKFSKLFAERVKDPEFAEKNRLSKIGRKHTEEHKEAIRAGLNKAVAEGRIVSQKIVKVCPTCGKQFKVSPSSADQINCSLQCAKIYRRKTKCVPSKNHKIVKIEDIGNHVVYDISVSGSELFGLDAGIYIHNTPFSPMHNSTVWVQSDSETYQRELDDLFDRIGLEERIHDWAYTLAAYGDLFVELNGVPGLGIVSVSDSEHPMNTSRVDYAGSLVGFYKSPQGYSQQGAGVDKQALIPPWKYVHMRLLGGAKKRSRFAENQYSEMRSVNLITSSETRQVTTRYGTSLLLNALPSYKRLRLAEDSLLMARVTRGIIKYIWKYKVDGTNMESVSALMDQYATLITRARAIDTNDATAGYDSKNNAMACLRGNTLIRLCDGEDISIKDMFEHQEMFLDKHVWSVNPQSLNLEPKKITKIMKTRENAQMVRVHLDNGKFVDCTPDHKFMLRMGNFKEAQHLEVNESLMPFYCKNSQVFGGHNRRNWKKDEVLNHKVVRVEWLNETEDVYDITVEDNHNFSLSNGVFVHNCVEDLFIPVWGDINDLTYEKVGGEADIRWIVDIDNLRNQLATALATPTALLGGYVKDATGSLGSEAIEALGVRFARSSRRIQRALIGGLVRMCQVHLAYKGLDPDPQLFQIQMAETSTAEENAIRKSLETGLKTLGSFMTTLKKVGGRKMDPVKVFEYYNEKILRLEDFRIEDFYKSKSDLDREAEAARAKAEAEKAAMSMPPETGEPVAAEKESERTPIRLVSSISEYVQEKKKNRPRVNEGRFNTDLYACLPAVLESKQWSEEKQNLLNESQVMIVDCTKEGSSDLEFLAERDFLTWYEKYGSAIITEEVEKVVVDKK